MTGIVSLKKARRLKIAKKFVDLYEIGPDVAAEYLFDLNIEMHDIIDNYRPLIHQEFLDRGWEFPEDGQPL